MSMGRGYLTPDFNERMGKFLRDAYLRHSASLCRNVGETEHGIAEGAIKAEERSFVNL
jgi:hypothetical protein